MKNRSVVALLLLAVCSGAASLFGQTLSFRADQVTVPPSQITGTKCVQVGIYMTTSGISGDWQQLTMNLDYTLNNGMVLSGDPVVEISDFVGTANAGFPEAGISSPGTPIANKTCASGDIINVATLGTGPAADYMPNAAVPSSGGGTGIPTEVVNTITQHLTISRLDPVANIFQAADGETLVAIASFPVDASSPAGAYIDVNFTGGANQNIIVNSARALIDSDGNNSDGYAVLFEDLDCAGATVADNNGTASGSSIEINYLDPNAGGTGGDITFTIPHAAQDPDEITITPDDGSGVITLTGVSIGSGSTTLTVSTSADGTPATGPGAVNYTIALGVNNPLGGLSFGTTCTATVTWAAPSCTATFNPVPTPGNATDLDAVLTNVLYDAGNSRFGNITGPNSTDVDLTAPTSTSGTALTFDNAYSIGSVSVSDVGAYTVTLNGPGGQSTTCSADLFLECPTNNVTCPSTTVVIGGDVTFDLVGDNVIDWDITYDGTTTNVPAGTANFTISGLVGDQTSFTVTANGQDESGPCSDSVTCDLNFADPSCDTSSPINPTVGGNPICPDGVLPLTVADLSFTTTGASSVDVPGAVAAFTPDVDPDTNNTVTWTGQVEITTIDAGIVITVNGPTGTTPDTSCSYESCLSVFVEDMAGLLGPTSLSFFGTPDFTFEVWAVTGTAGCTAITSPAGVDLTDIGGTQTLVGTITTDATGFGEGVFGSDLDFIEDACYYIVFDGVAYGGTLIGTVPTLGEWGLMAFVLLLMVAGVVTMRKKRFA
jgi:hypothetical protein